MAESNLLDASSVKTQRDFCRFVKELAESNGYSERTLEEYLRALWPLAQANKDAPVSFGLLASVLAEAWVSPIEPFDPEWLSYTDPPAELSQGAQAADSFGFLKKMLLYQIADLHRMKQEGVLDRPPHVLWLGASRKGGRQWFNFIPAYFLRCALGGMDPEANHTDCDWSVLAIFLWLGQIYE